MHYTHYNNPYSTDFLLSTTVLAMWLYLYIPSCINYDVLILNRNHRGCFLHVLEELLRFRFTLSSVNYSFPQDKVSCSDGMRAE